MLIDFILLDQVMFIQVKLAILKSNEKWHLNWQRKQLKKIFLNITKLGLKFFYALEFI